MQNLDVRLDSHKLMFHPQRVSDWLQAKTVYPLYMEISLASACNYRCAFCAYDFLDYKQEFMDTHKAKSVLSQAAACGVRSVNFSGQGEPLMQKDSAAIIAHAAAVGFDCALTTNGTLLRQEISERILTHLTWMRVSLNAATPSTYEAVHRHSPDGLAQVLKNLRTAVAIKQRDGLAVTISVQYLLIQENAAELTELVKQVKDIGIDYLSVKPFSFHPKSGAGASSVFAPEQLQQLQQQVQPYADERFKIMFRLQGFSKCQELQRPYPHCLGLPFFAEVTTSGDVYPCNNYIGSKEFCLGNVIDQTFKEIWEGEQRQAVMQRMQAMPVNGCRTGCRLDEINRYLWRLKQPQAHDNFI